MSENKLGLGMTIESVLEIWLVAMLVESLKYMTKFQFWPRLLAKNVYEKKLAA